MNAPTGITTPLSRDERRQLYRDLLATASQLARRAEPEAARLSDECWDMVAELACGCRCAEQAARALLTSAARWLARETEELTEPLHLGHTPTGEPVSVWRQTNAWTHREETFLEVGTRPPIQLDHLEPGLTDKLAASLRPAPLPRAARMSTTGPVGVAARRREASVDA